MQSAVGYQVLCKDPTASKEQGGSCAPHAHPQDCNTFQGPMSLPSYFNRDLFTQLCRAQRAVTLCARTHRLTRATRVAVSRAYSKALKTFSRPSALLPGVHCILLITHAERKGLSRVVRGPTTSKEQGGIGDRAHAQAWKTFQVLRVLGFGLRGQVLRGSGVYYSNQYLRVTSQKQGTHADVSVMS